MTQNYHQAPSPMEILLSYIRGLGRTAVKDKSFSNTCSSPGKHREKRPSSQQALLCQLHFALMWSEGVIWRLKGSPATILALSTHSLTAWVHGKGVQRRGSCRKRFFQFVYEDQATTPSDLCMKLTRINTAKALRTELRWNTVWFQIGLWVAHKQGRPK